MDKLFQPYAEAFDGITYNLKDRVRKLWFKLRIVVRCGWVVTGKDLDSSDKPSGLAGTVFGAVKAYCIKLKGAGAKSPPPADIYNAAWCFVGTFLGLIILSTVHYLVMVPDENFPYAMMSPMLASLATLIYAAPASPFGQPKMCLVGHVIGLVVACTVDYFCNPDKFPATNVLPQWLGVTLVPSITIALMQATGTVNPPSAAAATIYITGSKTIKAWGWMSIALPNAAACVIMILVGVLVNNISSKRKYPQFWW